jgi:TPP-dependent 2-oxoacid decarboxylase
MSNANLNIGNYLIQRLYDYGIRHVFGVPGDFILGFYQQLIQSNKLKVINTCDELLNLLLISSDMEIYENIWRTLSEKI